MKGALTERKLRLAGALAPWHKAKEATAQRARARTARVANGGILREGLQLVAALVSPAPEVDQSQGNNSGAVDLVGHGREGGMKG